MEDSLGRVAAILLAVFLMFVVPLQYAASRMHFMEEMYVQAKTIEFVDAVRNTGKITPAMYERYQREIQTLHSRYELTLEHSIDGIHQGQQVCQRYYKADIEQKLYEAGEAYGLRIADSIKARVVNQNQEVVCYYGGYIKNEVY